MDQDNLKKWEILTKSAIDKLVSNRYDYERLSPEEQELAALWKLESDMGNGGFLQFFCNSGPPSYEIALRALKNISAESIYNVIIKEYSIIQRLEDDARVQTLWDIPKYLTQEETDQLAQLDKAFWNSSENIIALGLAYYDKY
jgi:hypothetical protein